MPTYVIASQTPNAIISGGDRREIAWIHGNGLGTFGVAAIGTSVAYVQRPKGAVYEPCEASAPEPITVGQLWPRGSL